MFKIFEPGRIFVITSKAHKYVMFLFVIVICIGLLEALIFSPEDYKQGDSVRIMYVHVPAAWISLGIFSSITFLSLIGYIFKNKNFFLISKSLAPSGLVFNIVALVTGSIWGKPTWGTWWAWDARITSMLILALSDIGWEVLNKRWMFFFLGLAVLNECIWRTQTEEFWVNFKVWGMLPITIIFTGFQIPLINKYKIDAQ